MLSAILSVKAKVWARLVVQLDAVIVSVNVRELIFIDSLMYSVCHNSLYI